MKLSVIIVNYNVKYFLEQCLRSVMRALEGLSGEVLVVDNNSVDGSVAMVHADFPSVKLIENKTNTGFSKANNQAIQLANGEYILLVNPDTLVEEDAFKKIIAFMDAHPEAGGLGVKMIDGKGNFLPESKRGLPTPSVAFYKISGLAALFPKSKTFGKYHLGYLDESKTHEVEILAGAFMLLRKSVLDKTGLLDETFFMYGEDIDLSYRITRTGFKNYYFPEARIIHYKGESTRKSSVNYVYVFYKAMQLFAQKHFSAGRAQTFSLLVNLAIFMRATVALMMRIFKRMLLPLLDFTFILIGYYFIKNYWQTSVKELHYPYAYMHLVVPMYILIWITGIFLSGGYDKPVSLPKVVRGIFSGTVFILVVYALLSEDYRYSRALILINTLWASVVTVIYRYVLSMTGSKMFALHTNARKRIAICSGSDEGSRVLSLIRMADAQVEFIGFINTLGEDRLSHNSPFYLGSITKLKDMVEVYRINELIFCARDLSSQQIIDLMLAVNRHHVEIKIAPPGSAYIIGSNSINEQGDLYFVDLNSMLKPANRRKKRLLDMLTSLIFYVLSPGMVLFVDEPWQFLKNITLVLRGKYTWVSISQPPAATRNKNGQSHKRGILTPLDAVANHTVDEATAQRLNMLYAKEYKAGNDVRIILKGWRNAGRRV